jgi:hypothetical protein
VSAKKTPKVSAVAGRFSGRLGGWRRAFGSRFAERLVVGVKPLAIV